MPKPTNQMEWLMDVFSHRPPHDTPKNVEKIKLSKLVSKLGFIYEKFRNAIDYHEEHLVRRNSVLRLLRRKIILLQEKDAQEISRDLIYEFIRARYLPNDTLPETIIGEVAVTIEKYLKIVGYLGSRKPTKYGKLTDWIMSMAACEINDQLSPEKTEQDSAIANFMYSHLVEKLHFINLKIDEKERNLQIYIAVLRTLLKSDKTAIEYSLLKLHLPGWTKLDENEIRAFCKNIGAIKNKIDIKINHSLGFQLARNIRTQSVFCDILRKTIEENKDNLRKVFDQPEVLEEKIEDITLANYHNIHRKLIGTIIRVIIYIFLTKTVVAVALEVPIDYFILKQIYWQSLIINIVFHPLLMLFIALTIRVPGSKNTKVIVDEVKKIVYGEERELLFKPKGLMARGSSSYFVFNTLYLIMFALSFGIVIGVLKMIHFNIVSGVIFVFFLTLVSFFGFRLRSLANQFLVLPRKDNLFNFLVDVISLPIVRVGRFLSSNFSKINIFLYILDFIIETPFKMLIEFFEKALSFIKEKKEEITEETGN